MLRNPASRSLFRTLASSSAPHFRPVHQTSKLYTRTSHRPQLVINAVRRPVSALLVRQQSTQWTIDHKHEAEVGREKLKANPQSVTPTSSVNPVLHDAKTSDLHGDTDMMAGIRADMQTIRDTFDLSEVPKHAYYIGFAGVLPYLATSISTVFCAEEITRAAETGSGLLFQEETAYLLLQVLEPLQVGYGAVILSCLGTIHWGLEWAGYGGNHGFRRYAIGVITPAVAWPTILLPPTSALIVQFFAFNFLYYADTRAARRGWAPPWYGTYRFVLTFIVGASIVISLIGRSQITDKGHRLPGPADRVKALGDHVERLREEQERKTKILEEEGKVDQ